MDASDILIERLSKRIEEAGAAEAKAIKSFLRAAGAPEEEFQAASAAWRKARQTLDDLRRKHQNYVDNRAIERSLRPQSRPGRGSKGSV